MMVVPLVKLVLKEKRDELCCHAGDTQHCVKPLTLWAPATSQTDHQPQGDEGSVKISLRLHCSHLLLIRIPSKPSFHSLHWKQFLLGSWWMRAHKFNTTLHPVDKIEKNCTMNLKKPWHHLVRAKEDPDQETTIYLQPKKHWWELSSVGFMSSVVKSKTWSKTSKLQLLFQTGQQQIIWRTKKSKTFQHFRQCCLLLCFQQKDKDKIKSFYSQIQKKEWRHTHRLNHHASS